MNVGVNGAARNITDFKVGINGAVRSVKEAYIGISGAVKQVWPNIKPLNDCTWEEISEISSSGQAENYFAVGDCKEITLNGNVGALNLSNFKTYAFIIGINHNATTEGNNLIHFQLAKTALTGGKDTCFVDELYLSTGSSTAFRMSTSKSNYGGWASSQMRNNICGTSEVSANDKMLGAIQPELLSVLKPVTKYTNNIGESQNQSVITATSDYFFLLSEYEVFGNITYANSYEANYQQQYAYYSAGNSKVKYKHNGTSTAASWWLRSPYAAYSAGFVFVITSGSVYTNFANISLGFAPGFCV